MYITKLYIRNFRNIGEAELELDKNLNIFVGRNAQGKTNLCEAISVCLGGSFRRVRFSQYIPADNQKSEVAVKLFFRDDITDDQVKLFGRNMVCLQIFLHRRHCTGI